MAYSTINKSTDFFNTKLFTGNGASSHAITGVGHKPDFTWIKARGGTQFHNLVDSVRGVTKILYANNKEAETTDTTRFTSFNSDGFTLDNDADVNGSGATFASWNWKAGTAVSGNTTGSGSYKTYTGSVSTISGISIIKYTGNGSAGHTIPHHLGAVPKLIIVRQLGGDDWKVYSSGLPDASKSIKLDESGSYDNDAIAWNSTAPSNSVFTLGTASATNKVNESYISYCFADVTGYSKFGSYIANGSSTNGTFTYTGFAPKFVMIKRITSADHWVMNDSTRSTNENNNTLKADTNEVEYTSSAYGIDLLSNGFKPYTSDGNYNANGDTYIYMSFGQSLVGSNNVPCTAR